MVLALPVEARYDFPALSIHKPPEGITGGSAAMTKKDRQERKTRGERTLKKLLEEQAKQEQERYERYEEPLMVDLTRLRDYSSFQLTFANRRIAEELYRRCEHERDFVKKREQM